MSVIEIDSTASGHLASALSPPPERGPDTGAEVGLGRLAHFQRKWSPFSCSIMR